MPFCSRYSRIVVPILVDRERDFGCSPGVVEKIA
jgi:hypothetical protein